MIAALTGFVSASLADGLYRLDFYGRFRQVNFDTCKGA
jgi:hypothetical protein